MFHYVNLSSSTTPGGCSTFHRVYSLISFSFFISLSLPVFLIIYLSHSPSFCLSIYLSIHISFLSIFPIPPPSPHALFKCIMSTPLQNILSKTRNMSISERGSKCFFCQKCNYQHMIFFHTYLTQSMIHFDYEGGKYFVVGISACARTKLHFKISFDLNEASIIILSISYF